MRVADWLMQQVKDEFRRSRDAAAAKEILGIRGTPDIAYRSASVHSQYRQGVHPDNLDPLLSFVGDDIRRAFDPADGSFSLEVKDQLAVPIGQSQVRFGSPTSDGGTRVLFGYGDEGEQNRLRRKSTPLHLPFYWELDDVGDDLVYRYIQGKGKVGRPLWRIVERRDEGGKKHPHIPEVGLDGMLRTDFLLVTRVRNYLGDNWQGGSFVVSFGGAHGTGTRAVQLLVRDQEELARVYRALKRLARREGLSSDVPPCFQLLFAVEVKNDPKLGSFGRRIRLVGEALIENDEEQWKQAARLVRPALEDWQRAPKPADGR